MATKEEQQDTNENCQPYKKLCLGGEISTLQTSSLCSDANTQNKRIVIPWSDYLFRSDSLIDWENCPDFYVAGGYVLNCVVHDSIAISNSDIDVWMVNANEPVQPELFDRQIIDLMTHLQRRWTVTKCDNNIYLYNPSVGRNGELYHLESTESKYQYLYKIQLQTSWVYSDVYQLLRSFDLPNCQFAYRRGTVYATRDAIDYLHTLHIDYYLDPEIMKNPRLGEPKLRRIGKYKQREYHTMKETLVRPKYWSDLSALYYDMPPEREFQRFFHADNPPIFAREIKTSLQVSVKPSVSDDSLFERLFHILCNIVEEKTYRLLTSTCDTEQYTLLNVYPDKFNDSCGYSIARQIHNCIGINVYPTGNKLVY